MRVAFITICYPNQSRVPEWQPDDCDFSTQDIIVRGAQH